MSEGGKHKACDAPPSEQISRKRPRTERQWKWARFAGARHKAEHQTTPEKADETRERATTSPGEAKEKLQVPTLTVPSPPRKKQVLSQSERHELRTLLVGADLTKVTVGQARQQLEARLGVETGAMVASDKQGRELGRTLRYEVLRRMHGSETCEQIAKILMDSGRYPRTSCLMLLDALPAALVRCDGALHKHQLDVLKIAREALEDVRAQVQEDVVRCDERLREASFEVQARGLALEKNWLTSAEAGPLRVLLDGTWEEDEERDIALAAVQQRLVVLRTEESEIKSARKSLAARPADRGVFAKQVNKVIEQHLTDRIAKINSYLAEVQKAKEEQQQNGGTITMPETDIITAHPAFTEASAEAFSEPMKRRAEATEQANKAKAQLEDFNRALEALEKLTAGPPPAPAPAEAPAATAPPAEEESTPAGVTAADQEGQLAPVVETELNGSPKAESGELAHDAVDGNEPTVCGGKVVLDVDTMLASIGAADGEVRGAVQTMKEPVSPASPQGAIASPGGQLLGGG